MAPREFDLNRVPDDYDGIDWEDAIGGRDGDGRARELDRDMVRGNGETDGDELGVAHNQGDGDSHDAPSGRYNDPIRGHGSNGKKKRMYYSDDLKIAIYLELLAKTDPPVLRRGVSSQVAQKFGVPRRIVQSVWRKGQDYGIDSVKNKMSKNCGRKRVEIDFEAIEAVPLSERTSFQKLANALGVKKSTLHSRFKEGYFIRTPKFQGRVFCQGDEHT